MLLFTRNLFGYNFYLTLVTAPVLFFPWLFIDLLASILTAKAELSCCISSTRFLSTHVCCCLQVYGLDLNNMVGQAYDGASVMSGKNHGVQQRISQVAKHAYYVHCCAHRLSLILVDACKTVREAREFFALLELIYVFVSGSRMHIHWLDVQKNMYPNEQPRELQRLSDTRWACRAIACRNMTDRLPALKQFLTDIADDEDSDRAVEARGLLAQLNFLFVQQLVFFF